MFMIMQGEFGKNMHSRLVRMLPDTANSLLMRMVMLGWGIPAGAGRWGG